MSRVTLAEAHSKIIAESMYRVASCDGMDAREQALLDLFLQCSATQLTLEEISARASRFDYPRTALGSTWMRRILLRTCIAMARVTGQVAPAQRDVILDLARRLGIAEEAITIELDTPAHEAESMDWLQDLAIDFISWDDFPSKAYFWSFPHDEYPVGHGASIRVHEGQALLVGHKGRWTDLLGPGGYLFVPECVPGYSQMTGWTDNKTFPDLLFVRTGLSPVLRWGLGNGIKLKAGAGDEFRLQAFGKAIVSLDNVVELASRFLCGTIPDESEMNGRLARILAGRFAVALLEVEPEETRGLLPLLEDMDRLRDRVAPRIRDAMAQSGLGLHRFEIENLTAPPGVGLRATSARSKAMHMVGSQIMSGDSSVGGTRRNLYLESTQSGNHEPIDKADTQGSLNGSLDTALDFDPSTDG